MPILTVEVSNDVAAALDRHAGARLLSRRQYVRAVLAAVAAQAVREELPSRGTRPPDVQAVPRASGRSGQ